jgi:peptide/nickel transport system substrate-binding protein
MRKPLAALLTAFLLAGAASTLPAQAFQRGGSLQVVSLDEPLLLNPLFEEGPAAQELYNLIYSGLIRFDSGLDMQPDLLQTVPTFQNGGVQKLPNGEMVVTYRLRNGLKWHDGKPLTAEDIQFTWQAHMDPRVKYPPTPGYETIRLVEVVNETTAKAYYHRVYPDYFKLFRHVLPKHSFRSPYWKLDRNHPYNKHPIGSGPFALKSWKNGEAVFNANPTYHLAPPNLDQIRYVFKPGDFKSLPQVVDWAANADVMQRMSIGAYDYLKANPDLQLHVIATPQIEHLSFNLQDPLSADLRIRRAIALTIDRQAISDTLFGLAEPAYSDQHRGSWKYNAQVERFYRHDPVYAAKLLDEAGWKREGEGPRRNGSGDPLVMTIAISSGNLSHQLISGYMKQALGALGVEVKTFVLPADRLLNTVLPGGDYQMALASWDGSPFNIPFKRWHSTMVPPAGQNVTRFNDYQADRLLNELDRTVDLAKQQRLYQQLAEVLAEQLPALPLYYAPMVEAYRKTVHNVSPNPYTGTTWNSFQWWMEQRG